MKNLILLIASFAIISYKDQISVKVETGQINTVVIDSTHIAYDTATVSSDSLIKVKINKY